MPGVLFAKEEQSFIRVKSSKKVFENPACTNMLSPHNSPRHLFLRFSLHFKDDKFSRKRCIPEKQDQVVRSLDNVIREQRFFTAV